MCCNGHRKALEAKAALYDRLCGGEGLRRVGSDDSEGEEEEEGRYMVDFTRKIAEEVNVHIYTWDHTSYYTSVLYTCISMTCMLYMYFTPFIVCVKLYIYIYICTCIHIYIYVHVHAYIVYTMRCQVNVPPVTTEKNEFPFGMHVCVYVQCTCMCVQCTWCIYIIMYIICSALSQAYMAVHTLVQCMCSVCSFIHVSLNKCVCSVVSLYKCTCIHVCHMKLFLHYPQQKVKQEAATSSADHKDSDVKEGVAEEEGEWVEYVDSFGRTRRCPKEDLPHIQAEEQRRRERSECDSTPIQDNHHSSQ